MLLIQIILIVFFLFALGKTVWRFRRRDVSLLDLFWWVALWTIGIAVVAAPDSTMRLAGILGVGRGVDAIIYLSIAGLFYLFFRLLIKMEKIQRDLVKLARKLALLEKSGKEPSSESPDVVKIN